MPLIIRLALSQSDFRRKLHHKSKLRNKAAFKIKSLSSFIKTASWVAWKDMWSRDEHVGGFDISAGMELSMSMILHQKQHLHLLALMWHTKQTQSTQCSRTCGLQHWISLFFFKNEVQAAQAANQIVRRHPAKTCSRQQPEDWHAEGTSQSQLKATCKVSKCCTQKGPRVRSKQQGSFVTATLVRTRHKDFPPVADGFGARRHSLFQARERTCTADLIVNRTVRPLVLSLLSLRACLIRFNSRILPPRPISNRGRAYLWQCLTHMQPRKGRCVCCFHIHSTRMFHLYSPLIIVWACCE